MYHLLVIVITFRNLLNRTIFPANGITLFRPLLVNFNDMETIDLESFPGMAGLKYVSDTEDGIVREMREEGFVYLLDGREVTDERELERIRRLAIPPAWQNVWICRDPNGHIQSTGYDARNRKQYRYHVQWQESRNRTKFDKLYAFGKVLPKLRARVRKDMAKRSLTEEKVIATVLRLMENTYIRIGNGQYERDNKSYGLTTLKDRHVKIEGDRLQFSFTGKKGIGHRIILRDRQLARIVKQCRDIPGKELFQYLDSGGNHKPIDSGKVNNYIREATGGDFTAKDLRTWAGTIHSLRALHAAGSAETAAEKKRRIIEALDDVSRKLGNTRTVCKKYYVHPLILEWYEDGQLARYLKELSKPLPGKDQALSAEEKVLMKILRRTAG
jgi:DNA topoisomerase I